MVSEARSQSPTIMWSFGNPGTPFMTPHNLLHIQYTLLYSSGICLPFICSLWSNCVHTFDCRNSCEFCCLYVNIKMRTCLSYKISVPFWFSQGPMPPPIIVYSIHYNHMFDYCTCCFNIAIQIHCSIKNPIQRSYVCEWITLLLVIPYEFGWYFQLDTALRCIEEWSEVNYGKHGNFNRL